MRLPEELVDFVEGGVSLLVGTRDESLLPEAVRAVGATVSTDRTRVTLLFNEAVSARTLANIEAGSAVAVTFSRPIDHRTVQLKGPVASVRAGTDADRVVAERYLSAFTEALYLVGMSRALVRRVRVWPAVAVEVAIAELFQQTPGPTAGERLARAR
ncbi:MAG: pyridoxamine 5'-phosphate oxidase family protein [Polyangiales bacterium]